MVGVVKASSRITHIALSPILHYVEESGVRGLGPHL